MVFLSIEALELADQVEHLATDWEISDRLDFSNIVVSSIEDRHNKNSIIFSTILDPNIKWYARARALLTTGYTELSNIHVFLPTSDTSVATGEDFPSMVSTPILTTDSDQKDHDLILFRIKAEGFSVIGNSSHVSTSWWIEDIDGIVVWNSLYNTIYRNELLMSDTLLKHNSIYRIKAVFHSSSNDSSSIGTYTITTNAGNDIELFTYIDYLDPQVDNALDIANIFGMTNVTWKLYEYIRDGTYEYTEDHYRDEVIVDEFISQGKYGMLNQDRTPKLAGKCQNEFANNDKICEGIIVSWSNVLDVKAYDGSREKYERYKLFIEMYLNTLYIANDMPYEVVNTPEPFAVCEKCGTIYYLNKDGTSMAIPMAKREQGITNFRALPAGKYQIQDYPSDDKPIVTSFGPVSTYTHYHELISNPDYKPPNNPEVLPLKDIRYKNIVWETNYPNRGNIGLKSYAIAIGNGASIKPPGNNKDSLKWLASTITTKTDEKLNVLTQNGNSVTNWTEELKNIKDSDLVPPIELDVFGEASYDKDTNTLTINNLEKQFGFTLKNNTKAPSTTNGNNTTVSDITQNLSTNNSANYDPIWIAPYTSPNINMVNLVNPLDTPEATKIKLLTDLDSLNFDAPAYLEIENVDGLEWVSWQIVPEEALIPYDYASKTMDIGNNTAARIVDVLTLHSDDPNDPRLNKNTSNSVDMTATGKEVEIVPNLNLKRILPGDENTAKLVNLVWNLENTPVQRQSFYTTIGIEPIEGLEWLNIQVWDAEAVSNYIPEALEVYQDDTNNNKPSKPTPPTNNDNNVSKPPNDTVTGNNGYYIIEEYSTYNSLKGTMYVPRNDEVFRNYLYFLDPKDSLFNYAGPRFVSLDMIDTIRTDLQYNGLDLNKVGPFKYFLRYPNGNIEVNNSSNNPSEYYIQYTYDRGEDLKIVGYITYNEHMQPTRWINVVDDETSYIELNENYTDEYYKGESKEIYGVIVWY